MGTLLKEEGIFIFGTVFLALLVAGSSYAGEGRQGVGVTPQPQVQTSAPAVSLTTTVPAQLATSSPVVSSQASPVTKPASPAPIRRPRSREYDDD